MSVGSGGVGGGGSGSKSQNERANFADATAGAPNTGGGGGASVAQGGSGIVIIRYAGAQVATGGTVTNPSPGAYTVHTFTGDGSFVVGTTSYFIN
jgi:hypothetical protein